MHLLILYDISDDKRRRVVDKIFPHYGRRVNYSVFKVELTKSKIRKLIKTLEENTDKNNIIGFQMNHLKRAMLNGTTYKGFVNKY